MNVTYRKIILWLLALAVFILLTLLPALGESDSPL